MTEGVLSTQALLGSQDLGVALGHVSEHRLELVVLAQHLELKARHVGGAARSLPAKHALSCLKRTTLCFGSHYLHRSACPEFRIDLIGIERDK